jgi:hypothetical protein
MKGHVKRVRGNVADVSSGATTAGAAHATTDSNETARNGVFVVVLFCLLLCLIIFVSMMIGHVAHITIPRDGGSPPPPLMDHNDDTVNPLTGQAKFSGRESPALCRGKIVFPRAMIAGPCEGYFDVPRTANNATSDDDDNNVHAQELPLPARHRYVFCGLDEWARRLQAVEKAAIRDETADTPSFGVQVHRQRGLSVSRITGKLLGNKEFTDWLSFTDKYLEDHPKVQQEADGAGKIFASVDKQHREGEFNRRIHSNKLGAGDVVCWTGDFREHYVQGFNVVPSEEFYLYVLAKYEHLEAVARHDG